MNNSIRKNEEVRGLKAKGQEYNLLGFADDMALILENLIKGYNALKLEFDQYSEAAGMKININKMKILVKKLTQD